MDGFQLCRELKKDAYLRDIPFIFYTATYTDPRDAAFALSLGADKFLIKPLEPEVFIKAIQEVVDHKAVAAPSGATEALTEDEAIYLKEYNARLITKLEKKMLDLEAANRALIDDIEERERSARERLRLEEKLRHAQKMEAIGTLAGGIAHDFNNILAGIIGFAELGLDEVSNPLSCDQHFREIVKAGQRARDLVRQILASAASASRIANRSSSTRRCRKRSSCCAQRFPFRSRSFPGSTKRRRRFLPTARRCTRS
jgi:response regulator RpfG family c-di-GMP phosphodiesterase